MTEAREATLAAVRPRGISNELSALEKALRLLPGVTRLDDFGDLVTGLKGRRTRRRSMPKMNFDEALVRRRKLGVTKPDRETLLKESVTWQNENAVRDAARIVAEKGAATSSQKASAMLDWLSLSPLERVARWPDWRDQFLSKTEAKPYAAATLINKKLSDTNKQLGEILVAEAIRVAAIDDQCRALDVARFSEALLTLADPLLDRYDARKEAAGLLEFDDLIQLGSGLLVNPGASWVLYKLDGGLDHLLLDEVQDTAPAQWKIAHSLTREFFAGEGAREEPRTVFAVGDRKQSIFSFQGADVAGFESARQELRAQVENANQTWCDTPLTVSFRSTTAVLALVDAVFADPIAANGVVLPEEGTLIHRADREGQAGAVELWPLTEAPVSVAPAAWTTSDIYLPVTSAIDCLAEDLARWIKHQTSGAVMLESKNRPLRPGDVMILVRRRDALPTALVRSLKALGVPVAGLDRMILTKEPAVQDLMTLGDTLLLPQDDLSFACLLTSPLGGLDDTDLMQLAIGRDRPLWEVLRARHQEQASWTSAWTFFALQLSRVDFVSPHALYAQALSAHGARARLLGRLGAEAAEPIDEFLNAAMRYSISHPPSLQGFLHWLRGSGADIKREPEASGDKVRIMTVHNAKGLQAPLVILPDTVAVPPHDKGLLWQAGDGAGDQYSQDIPIWVPRGEFHCQATKRLRDDSRARRMEEYNRLLYVALTRAEDRLLICGAQPKKGKPGDASWYSMIARGMERLAPGDRDGGSFYSHPQTAPVEHERVSTAQTIGPATAPLFLGQPPAPEPSRPRPLAPSRPEGVELGPVPASASPLTRVDGPDRFQRGLLIHTLLQHLPAVAETERNTAMMSFLDRPVHGLKGGMARRIAEETQLILNHPELTDLFGPDGRPEVPLTGMVGDVIIGGIVDRLLVRSDHVTVVDFKTNRQVPKTIAETPVAYLRQMASYRAVLRLIFPGRAMTFALIWTRDAAVVTLPGPLLDLHEPVASVS